MSAWTSRPAGRSAGIFGLVLAALISWPAAPVAAATFTVNTLTVTGADVSPGDGVCATSVGTCTLQAAMQEANAHTGADTIEIPSGTYVVPPTQSFTASSDVVLRGAGSQVTILDRQNITGSIEVLGVTTGGRLRVEALSVRNAYVTNISAVVNHGAELMLSGVEISGCSAQQGGAVFNSGSLVAEDTRFIGNSNHDEVSGGGAVNIQGPAVFVRCSFEDNSTHDGLGGGLIVLRTSVDLSDCTFSGNTSHELAGDERGTGGALSTYDSTVRLRRCTFSTNHADNNGGAVDLRAGSAVLEDVTFESNTAGSYGGAIATSDGASVALINSTIHGNSAGTSSAYAVTYGTVTATAVNTILAGNGTSPCSTALTSLGQNVTDDGGCGFSAASDTVVSTGTLSFEAFGDHGGAVSTLPPAAGNPAIDGGDDSAAPSYDARGYARPAGAASDVGAVETGATAVNIVIFESGFESASTLLWSASVS